MRKLKATKKITLATLKSFAKRNAEHLYAKENSSFSGMSDMVENLTDPKWNKSAVTSDTGYYRTGIQGIYTVGSSRDSFGIYDDGEYFGITIYNCCGDSILAVNIKEQDEKKVAKVAKVEGDSELQIVKHGKVYALLGNSKEFAPQLNRKTGIGLKFIMGLNRPEGKMVGWLLYPEQIKEVAELTGATIEKE
jgi:hypothetical protein